MATLPSRRQQIIHAHAQLIIAVTHSALQGKVNGELDHALEVSAQNGWTDLVSAIRKILTGERELARLKPLDEEDSTIVEAILQGIQNPETLPEPQDQADPILAAPGLARLIHEARTGHVDALQVLANMAEQMTHVGGDMGALGGLMKRLVDGERDADQLCRGLGAHGRSLLVSVLQELGRLEAH